MNKEDKDFLRLLKMHKVSWGYDSMEAVKRLSKEGYTEYKSDMYHGWWQITDKTRREL